MQRKIFKALGTSTVQADQLADQRLPLSGQELLERAAKERARLEACDQLDTVGDLQPRHAPALNGDLIGRKLEIRWRYWRKTMQGEKGKKKQVLLAEPQPQPQRSSPTCIPIPTPPRPIPNHQPQP